MNSGVNTAWEQYGLIVELASRMQERGYTLGKTALQKLVYFLDELYEIRCGYEFILYTYGPFSAQLLNDLDLTRMLSGVQVDYDSSTGGYQITPGTEAASLRDKATEFLQASRTAIQNVVQNFGRMSAKDLELRATIVYASRMIDGIDNIESVNRLVSTVHDLKPHFSEAVIRGAVSELRNHQFLH